MPNKNKVFLNWSGGKDCALALYYLQQQNVISVETLLTTLSAAYNRISMHGVRESMLRKQTSRIEIPLQTIYMPEKASMQSYESVMQVALKELCEKNITTAAFGDIFLEDLRAYREANLHKMNVQAVFPLWSRNTTNLLLEFINLGFRAVTTCVNAVVLDKSFVGREIDLQFLQDLPPHVDPCGENGEFHSFVFDGPIFKQPLPISVGEIVYKTYPFISNNTANQNSENQNCFQQKAETEAAFWFCEIHEA